MTDKPVIGGVPDWALAMKLRRVKLGYSQEQLAAETEYIVSQGTVSDIENGKTKPWKMEAVKLGALMAALRWSPGEFEQETGISLPGITNHVYAELVNENIKHTTRRINVYDMVAAGPGADGGSPIDVIDIPLAWQGDYVGYLISGDSMGALLDGATVVVKDQPYAEPGEVIVCWAPEYGMMMKRYGGVLPGGYHLLQSQNPMHAPVWTKDLHIKGVVKDVRLAVDRVFPRYAPPAEEVS